MIKIGKSMTLSSYEIDAVSATNLDLFCKQDGLERQGSFHFFKHGVAHLLIHLFSANNLEPVRPVHLHHHRQCQSHLLVQDFSIRRHHEL